MSIDIKIGSLVKLRDIAEQKYYGVKFYEKNVGLIVEITPSGFFKVCWLIKKNGWIKNSYEKNLEIVE